MTPIDDSNTHDSENTPPGYWFGELDTRLRDRMRDELRELDLGRRGWRVLHTLADGPATADQLADALPHRGRRGRERAFGAGLPGDAGEASADTAPERSDAVSAREWRGRPDWMRREWERRQQMYRAWMEHDNARVHDEPGGHAGHEHGDDGHKHGHDGDHDTYGPESREGGTGSGRHDRDEHREDEHHAHEHHAHDHHHGPHDEHGDHHQHPDHHRHAEQAFERGFERGFVRGVERGSAFGHGGHGFGPGGSGYSGFGPGRYGRPFGRGDLGGRFGPDASGHERFGRDRPPFAGRRGFGGRCGGGVDRILADFVERGWVWFDGDRATLTDEGRAAHDAAFERIRTVRARVADGIDPSDLATTLATLEAMARNLGWTPSAERTDASGEESGAGTDTPDTEEGTDAD